MHDAQPPASLLAPAIMRQVRAAGGFATVIHKGSAFGSAMLIITRHQDIVIVYERLPSLSGGTQWQVAANSEEGVSKFVHRQCSFDPDLWVIELDIADSERFIPR